MKIFFKLVATTLSRHDDLLSRHDDLLSRHDDLISRHDDLKSRHDDFTTRHDDFGLLYKKQISVSWPVPLARRKAFSCTAYASNVCVRPIWHVLSHKIDDY